jgi:excisionase family DNA binding protein
MYESATIPVMDTTMITRRQAADRAGVNVRTVDLWCRNGKLTGHKDGRGRVWVKEEELNRLLTPQPMTSTR